MKWTTALHWILAAAFSYVVLAYFAGFSVRQSVVLALLIAWLVEGIGNASGLFVRRLRFTPYYVRIGPNWHNLLIDFKLICTPAEWHAIQESFERLPLTEYRVLRSGVCFTVVQQSEDFEQTLIYSDNHQAFVSEVDFQEDMEPLRVEPDSKWEREFGRVGNSDVQILVKFGSDGYNLGIRVPISWWDEVKASCPKALKEDRDPPSLVGGAGRVKLILATISYREFDLHWEPVVRSSIFHDKAAKQIRKRRDEERERFGWKTIEQDSDMGRELGWPETIEHTYFTVEHRAI